LEVSGTIRAVPATVLIVDYHAEFRAAARAMLEAGGFPVIGEAADGVSALAEAARESLEPGDLREALPQPEDRRGARATDLPQARPARIAGAPPPRSGDAVVPTSA